MSPCVQLPAVTIAALGRPQNVLSHMSFERQGSPKRPWLHEPGAPGSEPHLPLLQCVLS
jgi:hypothetical protein